MTFEGFHGSGTPNNSRSIAHAHALVLSTYDGFWRAAQQVYVTSPGRTVNPESCEPLARAVRIDRLDPTCEQSRREENETEEKSDLAGVQISDYPFLAR